MTTFASSGGNGKSLWELHRVPITMAARTQPFAPELGAR
eukprot:CAMPEP_0198593316 /NCGR_PEP_ID=MMETSP1462-20131121/139234_1 /TAXON_ID=1333877 /ORGANISM="Brandtodinium nutriculum, Strain RCC3387" /LENGTH=38 /DNA_ID= /DNA_START= /DNA_END= /DNA_ORIENTATION=